MTTTTNLFKNMTGGRPVAAGSVIFETGDKADHLYVVQEGKVEIRVAGDVVEIVGPGGIFGEMAMIDGSVRSADAVAVEDAVVFAVDEKRFDFLITQTPFFARTVMNVLADRLRAANRSST
jgi:CRP/FNR family transcriptional regulator, cyclic AMP receptor protein